VTIESFNSGVSVPVTAGAPGKATITATLGASTQSVVITVGATPSIEIDSFEGARFQTGDIVTLPVRADMQLAADGIVALTSSNPDVFPVPASVTIAAGDSSASPLQVVAGIPGTATLTATLGPSAAQLQLTVVNGPSIEFLSLADRLQTGRVTNLSISADVPPASDVEITLTSSDANVISLPASVTLQRGSTFTFVRLQAGNPGVAVITATLGASSRSVITTVVATPVVRSIFLDPFGSKIQTGLVGTVSASLDADPAAETTMSFTSNNPAAVTVAPSALLQPGETSGGATLNAVAPGFATVTASALGSSRGMLLEVVSGPSQINLFFFPTPKIGHTTSVSVNLDCVVSADTTITLTQTDPTALSIPASAVVPAGESQVQVDVMGLAMLPTTVTATLGGVSGMSLVTPVP
jgi:hypothetical protein